jgi:predicted metalloprotease with PDZ domain
MILRQTVFKSQMENQVRRFKSGMDACRIAFILFPLFMILSGGVSFAETLNVQISVVSLKPARMKIEGERQKETRAWSFRNVYANVINLGERIENLNLTDAKGAQITVRKLAPGEYEAASAAARFSYEVKLDAPLFESDAAHVSWLTTAHGFLMLGDLLPLSNEKESTSVGASVVLKLPEQWNVASSFSAGADGKYKIADTESAVFFVGQDLREQKQRVGSLEFELATTGEWAFTDEELTSLAASILKDHAETFGGMAQSSAVLMLAPFPQQANADHWSAETRGTSVVMLAGRLPSKIAALAQLNFPLAHELFHLWIPNGLALDGNYDWFYEGFTLYQALRAGIRLNLFTFQDYLNALGRAYDAYKSTRERDQLSLLDASKQRWTLAPALVYNKGMLVAFLYDLTLRQQSKGKRSLDDVYRELFRLYHSSEAKKDGNRAVLAALNNEAGMQELTRRYIESAGSIDLPTAIAPFGLQAESVGARSYITVAASTNGAQRDLLRKFGYNEKTYGATGHRGVK